MKTLLDYTELVLTAITKDYYNEAIINAKENIYKSLINEVEKALIQEALTQCNWNQVHTARTLGINRLTLRKKMDKYGLSKI